MFIPYQYFAFFWIQRSFIGALHVLRPSVVTCPTLLKWFFWTNYFCNFLAKLSTNPF